MTTTHSDLDQSAADLHAVIVEVGPNSAPAICSSTPKAETPVRPNFPADQNHTGSQSRVVDGDLSSGTGQDIPVNQSAVVGAASTPHPPKTPPEPKVGPAGGVSISTDGHKRTGTHLRRAVGAPSPGQARVLPRPIEIAPVPGLLPSISAIGSAPAAMELPPRSRDLDDGSASPDRVVSTPMIATPRLADPFLALAADVLDDLERVRVANENRYRQLTRSGEDSDGEERGFGLTEDHPDVARLRALVDGLVKAEHQAQLNLERLMRRHPLGPWVKQARGVGEKQAARLLAAIGDPYFNSLHNRPRTVSELWAYCGYHVLPGGHAGSATAARESPAAGAQTDGNPNQRASGAQIGVVGVAAARARGQRANWSADAKMRAYLVATSCMKTTGEYREVYEEGRAKYADAVHQVECKRCGPSGQPALSGSPLSLGHQHARALRLVAKTVLRDLWRESKRLHDDHDQLRFA